MTWDTSDRRSRLPANWSTEIQPAVLKRDPTCRCPGCPRCTATGCPRSSTEADHVLPIDDHSLANLAGKCRQCHAYKSSTEGYAARRARGFTRRPAEPHPGLR